MRRDANRSNGEPQQNTSESKRRDETKIDRPTPRLLYFALVGLSMQAVEVAEEIMKCTLPVIAFALLIGCSAKEQPSSSASQDVARENVKMKKRVETIEADVLTARKDLIAEQQKNEDLRHRIAAIESLFADRLSAQASATTDVQPIAATEAQPKRGGFSDFGSSRPAPVSVPITAPSQQRGQILTLGSSASSSGDATIRAHCEQEWGTDFRMRAYCESQQTEAKQRIENRSASTSGVWPNDFDALRRQCQGEWPGDYKMQDYCEGKQIEAVKQIRH